MNIFLNKKQFYLFILFYSICSIFFALYVEHILQYKACTLCIYQRIPYIFIIFISLIGFYYSTSDKILILTIIIFILSAMISGYHFGVENSFFEELSTCTNNSLDLSNKKKLLESLSKNMPISCKDTTFKVLGLSLAAINTLLSILIVVISVRTLIYEKN